MRAQEFQKKIRDGGLPMMWRLFDFYTRKGHSAKDVIAALNRRFHLQLTIQDLERYYADSLIKENFADKKVQGKSRPGRVKRAGASCKGSVTDLRARAKRYSGERGKMYHWCANMKSGRKRAKK